MHYKLGVDVSLEAEAGAVCVGALLGGGGGCLGDEFAAEAALAVGVPDVFGEIAGVDGASYRVVELGERGPVDGELSDDVAVASVVVEQREPVGWAGVDGRDVADTANAYALVSFVGPVVRAVLEAGSEAVEAIEVVGFEDDHGEVGEGVGPILGRRGAREPATQTCGEGMEEHVERVGVVASEVDERADGRVGSFGVGVVVSDGLDNGGGVSEAVEAGFDSPARWEWPAGDPVVCAFEVSVGVGHGVLLPAGVLVGGCEMPVPDSVPDSLPEFVLTGGHSSQTAGQPAHGTGRGGRLGAEWWW